MDGRRFASSTPRLRELDSTAMPSMVGQFVASWVGGDWGQCYESYILWFTNRNDFIVSQVGNLSVAAAATAWDSLQQYLCPIYRPTITQHLHFAYEGPPWVTSAPNVVNMTNVNGTASVALIWSPPFPGSVNLSASSLSYNLQRSTDGGQVWANIGPLNSTSYTDTGLDLGANAVYRVRALNSFGAGMYSALTSVSMSFLPSPMPALQPSESTNNIFSGGISGMPVWFIAVIVVGGVLLLAGIAGFIYWRYIRNRQRYAVVGDYYGSRDVPLDISAPVSGGRVRASDLVAGSFSSHQGGGPRPTQSSSNYSLL